MSRIAGISVSQSKKPIRLANVRRTVLTPDYRAVALWRFICAV